MNRWRRKLLAAVVAAAIGWPAALPNSCSAQVIIQQGPGGIVQVTRPNEKKASDDDAPSVNVFPRPDRELIRYLHDAQELLKRERYHEAALLLGRILADAEDRRPSGNEEDQGPRDFFFQPDRKGEPEIHRSLKAEARRLIGLMPPEGREEYEKEYGADAQALLREAISRGRPELLAKASRCYFHTRAGYEATFLLGVDQLKRAQPLAGALTLGRLFQAPLGDDRFEPILSLTAASCWIQAGAPEKAESILQTLKARFPGARLPIAGRYVGLFEDDGEALDWFNVVAGPLADSGLAEPDRWLMFGGVPSRNSVTPNSAPLLNLRWHVAAHENPTTERLLRERRQYYVENQDQAILPGLHPLAVEDLVLMRTARNLLAVDFRTGKRLWAVPADDPLEPALGDPAPKSSQPKSSQIIDQLGRRMWHDATYGTLSSDGKLVFSIEDLKLTAPTRSSRAVFAFGGAQATSAAAPGSYNRLAAHDLSTGKLVWHLGGPADQFALPQSGTFFLGPPLPLMGYLYVLAESKGQVQLLALDPSREKRGKILWSQPLAEPEQDVLGAPLRRLAGVSPSYADGILVCPTAAGAVVAVDLATRSLLWGYCYRTPTQRHTGPGFIRLRVNASWVNQKITDRWTDNGAIIADGHVLLTPSESDALHCLDLATGKPVWEQPVARGDSLYVACAHDEKVLLVGRSTLRAIDLHTGRLAWGGQVTNLPEGSCPSGRGCFGGKEYYVPLNIGAVAVVDVATGKIDRLLRSRKGNIPGNLICYKGKVISQNCHRVEVFYQLETARRVAESSLAKNPNDPVALSLSGEILLNEGNRDAAIACFQRAYRAGGDVRTRHLLRDALLEGLQLQFAEYVGRTDEIERLLDTPEQQAHLLRLMAQGYRRIGQWQRAFGYCVTLMELDGVERRVDLVERTASVRRDCWIRAELAHLRDELEDGEAVRFDEMVEVRLQAALNSGQAAPLRRFLDYFEEHPLARVARQELAQRQGAADSVLETELLLWRDFRSPEAEVAGPATAMLAELLRKAGRSEDAAICYRRLRQEFGDVVCLSGKTGRELEAALPADGPLRDALKPVVDWPAGRVQTEVAKQRVGRNSSIASYRQPTGTVSYRGSAEPFLANVSLHHDHSRRMLVGQDLFGKELWRMALAETNRGRQVPFNNRQGGAARACGHLLLLASGGTVMAVDTLGTAGDPVPRIMWKKDLGVPGSQGGPFNLAANQVMMLPGGGFQLLGGAQRYSTKMLGDGPLTPRYVCFQRVRNLFAVDPLSGEVLWSRRNTPRAAALFGDDRYVFVLPAGRSESSVYSAIDGRLLGKRLVPLPQASAANATPQQESVVPFANCCLATLGRRLLMWYEEDNRRVLELYDPWLQEVCWSAQKFDSQAKVDVVDDDVVGVCEPDGHFVLLSLSDGRSLVDTHLKGADSFEQLTGVLVLRRCDTYLVVAQLPRKNVPQQHRSTQPLPGCVTQATPRGWAYAFDRTGRPLWPQPLEIDDQHLVLNQAPGLPVLTLGCRKYVRQNRNNRMSYVNKTSVVCVDKRTGRELYNEQLEGVAQAFRLTGDARNHRVELKFVQSGTGSTRTETTVAMRFTDEPNQPAKPKDASPKELLDKWRELKADGRPRQDAGRTDDEAPPEDAPPEYEEPLDPFR